MPKNLTQPELLKRAIEKQYFGDRDTLYACEDGNMWFEEEEARKNAESKDIQYFELKKDSKPESKPEFKKDK